MSTTAAERKYRKALDDLTVEVGAFLAALDIVMKRPPSPEKGKIVAKLATHLDMANDAAMHFTLDMSFRRINSRKAKAEASVKPSPRVKQ